MDHTPYDDDTPAACGRRATFAAAAACGCGEERDGEERPHGDHTPGGERRRRNEEKRVDHVRRAGHQSPATWITTATTSAPPTQRCKRRPHGPTDPADSRQPKAAAGGRAHRDHPRETGRYVDRVAPCEQRARRCGGDRNGDGCRKGGPDQGHPASPANPIRRAEARSAPEAGFACAPHHGRRKTVSKRCRCRRRGAHAAGRRRGRSAASPAGTYRPHR